MISPISFRAVQQPAGNFKDLVNKPQTYASGSKPQAAAPVSGKTKKGGKLKKILIGVGIAAGCAAALGLLATKGQNLLQPGENAILNGIKSVIRTVGGAIANVFSSIKNHFTPENLDDLADDFDDFADDYIDDAIDTVQNMAEKVTETAQNL